MGILALGVALKRMDEGSRRLLALALSLVAIWAVFQVLTGGLFLTPRNFYNLAVQSSTVAVLTIGMVMVIMTRNIDLSVGSILGLTGMVIALLQIEVFPADAAWNWPLTVLLGLALGTVIGLWQGFLVAYIGIPSFVVTLAGLLIFRGATFEVAQGQTLSPFQNIYRIFGGGAAGSLGETASWIVAALCAGIAGILIMRARRDRLLLVTTALGIAGLVAAVAMFNAYDRPRSELGHGIPSTILILGCLAAIAVFVMRRMPIGTHILAVGKDVEAARLVGVPTRRVVLKVFAAMGALCAVGAIITTARLNAGTTNLGTLMELNVIAAAVIGGASLDGGRGSIIGGVLGAFVIQSLDTGLVLLGVSSSMRQILIGFVLIGAVWFDRVAARHR
ncbi:ABC transporter permease subunit [Aestuariicoccus sp. MJ-SS9]|uniref:sugar ABC transporter permease n=1 Tax=Aestuariicoccus sp. MJ-SS9 TaxID=3079855 RepID=UPI002931672C|nr:sugar ABC transporter permease [Aestuariicoccus sp. MJ-SS9]